MSTVIEEIAGLVSSKIDTIKTMIDIVKLETRLAGLSVYPLIINVCMLFVVLITLWLSIMGTVFYFINAFVHNPFISILCVLSLNVLSLLGLLKYLSFNLKKMGFEKTRQYILKMRVNHHANHEEAPEYNSAQVRKKITESTKHRKKPQKIS